MKKRDVIAAVRRRYPDADPFTTSAHVCVIDAGGLSSPRNIIGTGFTEYSAWCDALRTVTREMETEG